MPATPPWRRTSCEQPPAAERVENDLLEGAPGVGAHVADAVAAAEMLQLRGVCFPSADVRARKAWCHVELALVAGLGVDEPDVTERRRIAIRLRRDVHDEDVVSERAQDLEPGLEAARIHEIRDDDGQPDLARPRREFLQVLPQIGRAAGFEALQPLADAKDASLAAPRRRFWRQSARRREDPQPAQIA